MSADPKVLSQKELDLLIASTGKDKETIEFEHKGFLAMFPDGMADRKGFAKLFAELSDKNTDPTKFASFLFKLFDADNSGKVSFSEFVQATGFWLLKGSSDAQLEKLFALLDRNGDKKISRKELAAFVNALVDISDKGNKAEAKEGVRETLDKYDKDKSGALDLEEFKKFMTEQEVTSIFSMIIALAELQTVAGAL